MTFRIARWPGGHAGRSPVKAPSAHLAYLNQRYARNLHGTTFVGQTREMYAAFARRTRVTDLRGIATLVRGSGAMTRDLPRQPLAERWQRWLFALYLLYVAVGSIRIGALEAQAIDPWTVGDWLINYSGGFVRRGFTGALVMLLHRATGIPLQWVVFSIQASVFLLFLVSVYQLTKGMRWSYLMAAVLLSPATLAFTVMNRYDAGLRKEILLFAALSVTVWVLLSERWKDWQISTLLSVFLVGLALSHEGLLVAAPYFFAAVAVQTSSLRRAVRICAIPFVLTAIASVAVITHHGDQATAQAICSSAGGTLGHAKPDALHPTGGFCGGAISFLQLDVAQEREIIVPMIRQWHLRRLFSALAIPTFLPLVALLWVFYRRDRLRVEVAIVLACAVVSMAGTSVLFYVGLDWGRWFHLQAICLMLLLMMLDHRGAATAVPATQRSLPFHVVATLALLLYATTWTLPGVGTGGETPGYVPLVWPTYRNALHQFRVTVIGGIRKIV